MRFAGFTDTPREWDIIGLGDIDIDMFLGVEHLAGRDEKVLGSLLGEHPGGMIANVCCAASVLGSSTAMIGRVGDDAYGTAATVSLTEHGVDTSLVRVIEHGRTFYCVVMLDGTGEKALTVVDTDCHLPKPEDVNVDSFGRARILHLMGDDLAMATWAAREARERGTVVSLDLETATAAHGLEALRPLLACTDYLFMNAAGCQTAFGANPDDAALKALLCGPRLAVVTLGPGGALVRTDNLRVRVRGVSTAAVDTTGAGDCFIGTFLNRLLAGWELARTARFAVAAASLSIGAVGSRSRLASLTEISDLSEQIEYEPSSSGAT